MHAQIYGISGGYSGFHDPDKPVIELDSATNLEFLQHRAGSILGCSAGGFDINKIMDFLISKEVSATASSCVSVIESTQHKLFSTCVYCVYREIACCIIAI
jgi:hypothetical protein